MVWSNFQPSQGSTAILTRHAQALAGLGGGASISQAAGSRHYGVPRPRYMYRVTFGGVVRVTTDPIEVARIRLHYPHARVEIIPCAN